MADKEALT